jgi:hypothetical protein
MILGEKFSPKDLEDDGGLLVSFFASTSTSVFTSFLPAR